jgi:hypothetical protein
MSRDFAFRPPKRSPLIWLIAIAGLAGTSCSSGPASLQAGTPAFYWADANAAYKAGDFPKTAENLQRIVALESEFNTRARVWDFVISGGLAQGYSEFADAYEAGVLMNRANPTPFRKQVREMRSLAVTYAVQMTEDIHQFMVQNKDPQVRLAFAYPAGSTQSPPTLKRIAGGIVVQDAEREQTLQTMLRRGVLLSLCCVVGYTGDSAKTAEVMKTTEVKVPRETFLLGAACALEEHSALFGPTKLDQPNRSNVMLQEALEALQQLPKSGDSTALTDKLQRALKKLPIPQV